MSLTKPKQLHLKEPVYVADVIGEVVERAAAYWGSAINYIHDSRKQVELRLQNKDRNKSVKYPLIVLFHDFPEQIGIDYYADVVLNVIILTDTKKEIFSDDRYDRTFKPTLYPIYGWFMKCLALHPMIVQTDPGNISAMKYDRLYWGTQPAGEQGLNDYVDGIELVNLKLRFQQEC
jgi:hypothetical protein